MGTLVCVTLDKSIHFHRYLLSNCIRHSIYKIFIEQFCQTSCLDAGETAGSKTDPSLIPGAHSPVGESRVRIIYMNVYNMLIKKFDKHHK